MNRVATTGKNLQIGFAVEKGKGAYETGLVSTPSLHNGNTALICSLAGRKPMQPRPSSTSPESRTARNYGNRKLRYRWVDGLKPWQVHQLHAADAMAEQLGLPLNTFVSIFWEATFPGSASMPSTFRLGMKRMGQWFRDNGIRNASVYVHENPDDAKLNSHLLVHVPKHLRRAFKAKAADWFQGLDGGVQVDLRNDADRQAKGLGTRLQYMAKGADDMTCRFYGGRRAKGGQGPIAIKRAGVAQCLTGKVEFRLASTREGFRDQYAPAREETRFLTVDNGSQGAA